MRIAIFDSARQAAASVADIVATAVRREPRLVVGLPTGRTMIPMYAALVRLARTRRLNLTRLTTFNLDEFDGISPETPGSYRSFMRAHLFDPLHVGAARAHFPSAQGVAAAAYDDLIATAGGLDLCVVGIGANGHLGFNEPADQLEARTHRVRLMPSTRRANAYLFGGRTADVPTHAVSMGIGTILGARLVVLLATGTEKAVVLRRALTGSVSTRLPASLLQVHPQVVVVLDRAAAQGLRAPRRRRGRALR